MRTIGTQVRGIRTPIIRQGDDLPAIVVDSLLTACEKEGFSLGDRDIVGITEAVLARAQGNYATVDDIAADIKEKFSDHTVGVVFPILSRNRFFTLLQGIARGAKRVVVQLSYPSDEVGNSLVTLDQLDEKNINPATDVLSEQQFRELFGRVRHIFTGVDYIDLYKSAGDNIEIIFSNDPRSILAHTKHVLTADIHTRKRTKKRLLSAGAQQVFGLDEVLNRPVNGSGYNEQYGILGSNLAVDEKIKLFPRDAQAFAEAVQARIRETVGAHVEVLVYGDGAFRDPVGQIWELADPVVSPGFTDGLRGTPHEVKLKYIADSQFGNLTGEAAQQAMVEYLRAQGKNPPKNDVSDMARQGTTPRQLTDLLGSLCDLTSGSGDKGTPVVLIQGYFDNYSTDA